jgi:1-acyl-sn-glycerol-3-phosphate acyltransferase
VYGWLGLDFKWVMKKEVRKIPGVGFGSAALGHIFIDRSNTKNAMASIHAARKKIRGGISVLFFPEGTRSKTDTMLPFKKGAFRFALDLGLPVLPMAIEGTEKILPNGTLDLVPGTARITILPPIDTTTYGETSIGQLMEESRKAIEGVLQSPAE